MNKRMLLILLLFVLVIPQVFADGLFYTFQVRPAPVTLPTTFTPLSESETIAWGINDTFLVRIGNSTRPINIYRKNTSAGFGYTLQANPATLPTGSAHAVVMSQNSSDYQWLIVGHATSPFVTIYQNSTHASGWTKITDPAALPSTTVQSLAITPDSTQFGMRHDLSANITFFYNVSAASWVKSVDYRVIHNSTGTTQGGIAFNATGQQFIAGGNKAVSMLNNATLYLKNASAIGGWQNMTPPATWINGTTYNSAAFSTGRGGFYNNTLAPNITFLVVGAKSPPLANQQIYFYSNSTHASGWTLATSPSTFPNSTSDVNAIEFSPDGRLMLIVLSSQELFMYGRNTSAASGWSYIPLLNSGFNNTAQFTGAAFSNDGKMLAVASDDLPYIFLYDIVFPFNVTARNAVNLTKLFTFNVTITGQGLTTNNYTSRTDVGEVEPANVLRGLLYNITISAVGYTTRTYTNYNTTADLTADLYRLYDNNSMVYDADVLEQINVTHNLTVMPSANKTYLSLNNSLNAQLFWNATQYNASRIGTSDNWTVTFGNGLIGNNATNISFYWRYTLNFTSGSQETENTTTNNQTLHRIVIDNTCTIGIRTLNISLRDEANESRMVANLSPEFIVWSYLNTSYTRTYQFGTLTGQNNYSFCLYPNWTIATTNTSFRYTQTNYSNRYYYQIGVNYTNVSQLIDLYLLHNDVSTAIIVFVFDSVTGDGIPDVFVKVQRYYPSDNSYKTIEILRQDDYGYSTTKLVTFDVDYRFQVETHNGTVLKLTSSAKITQAQINIPIQFTANFMDTFQKVSSISKRLTYNTSTQTFTYTWTDSNNFVAEGCLRTIRRTVLGDSEICNNCTNTTAGSRLCTIGGTPSGVYIATGEVKKNNYSYGIDQLEQDFAGAYATIGNYGLFLAIFFILTVAAAGVWNPVVALILCVLALVAAVATGLVALQYSVVIAFVIVIGIAIFKARS